MKTTYLKTFFLAAMIAPMLSFGAEENYLVGERATKFNGEMQEGGSKSIFSQYPPVYYPPAVHCLKSVSVLGDSVEIEDGSVWKISSFDADKVRYWKSTDVILITQNHSWFSKYKYKLVNETIGSSLEAKLHLGPSKRSEYIRYVIETDIRDGIAILNDGTRWKVSSLDKHLFKEWELNDAVIIGYNSGWDSDCQGLLINVAMNQPIRAEQF